MENLKQTGAYAAILGAMNLIGGLLHIAFEYFLLDAGGVYRGFLLIENLLIGLVFIYFAYNIFFGGPEQKLRTMKTNFLFWLCFVASFLLFQPEVTSLNMIKDFLPLPQKHVLLATGVVALAFSIASCRTARNRHALPE